MMLDVSQTVRSAFAPIAAKRMLLEQNEVIDPPEYSIEYKCERFILQLEKYRVEFYAVLYKEDCEHREVALFNLLAYLAADRRASPVSEYFHTEENIERRYRKQVAHIASTFDKHYEDIEEFFRDGDVASKASAVESFIIKKYPGLFRQSN